MTIVLVIGGRKKVLRPYLSKASEHLFSSFIPPATVIPTGDAKRSEASNGGIWVHLTLIVDRLIKYNNEEHINT